MSLNRRRHDRESCKTLITCSEYRKSDYYKAIMYNQSLEGINFESDTGIQSGLPVCILMPTHIDMAPVDTPKVPETYAAYVARVRWCQRNGRDNNYKMGAQLMFQGYMRDARKADKACGACELCESKLFGKVYQTDESMDLCQSCFKYLGGRLEGCARESVIRFVIGNVI